MDEKQKEIAYYKEVLFHYFDRTYTQLNRDAFITRIIEDVDLNELEQGMRNEVLRWSQGKDFEYYKDALFDYMDRAYVLLNQDEFMTKIIQDADLNELEQAMKNEALRCIEVDAKYNAWLENNKKHQAFAKKLKKERAGRQRKIFEEWKEHEAERQLKIRESMK